MKNRYEQWLEIQARLTDEEKEALERVSEAILSREYLKPNSEYVKMVRRLMGVTS